MASASLKNVDKAIIKELKELYALFSMKSTIPTIDSMFKINGCVLTIYKNGTVFVQGDFDKLDKKLSTLFKNQINQPEKQVTDISQHVCGSDEVGTGEYIGPCVFASFFFDPTKASKIDQLRPYIKDSKKMSNAQIMELAPKLMEFGLHEIKVIEPTRVNKMMDDEINLNVIKTYGHLRLHGQHNYQACIIDGFASPKKINDYIYALEKVDAYYLWGLPIDQVRKVGNDFQIHNPPQVRATIKIIEKAEEKFICVAAGSIIARYTYLNWLSEKSKKYGIDLGPFSYKDQVNAVKNVRAKFGEDAVDEIAKTKFKVS